ncbi:MAG: undecaprenyl-diphosphatase UppP [Candidatus Kerfeldbacteria bacterium]|nr:undecaprenyl-diphosphatase UppP [Candidatus Kerfeldbacteria bacterium]
MSAVFDAIVLGAIQGLTEFLPISSSGHLLLAHELFGLDVRDSLTFDVALHVGTLIALLTYFWSDIWRLLTAVTHPGRAELATERRLAWLILLAAVPAALIGAILESFFSTLRSSAVVIVTMAAIGVLFLIAERIHRPRLELSAISWRASLAIGFSQALALIPGVSRSGITIVAGMLAGLSRAAAARFTFLLSIPTVAGAALKQLLAIEVWPATELTAIALGIASSAVVGYLVIRLLLRFLRNHRLDVFAFYRFVVATVAALILFNR